MYPTLILRRTNYLNKDPVFLQYTGDNTTRFFVKLVIIDFVTISHTLCRNVIDRPEYQNSEYYAPSAISYRYKKKKAAMSCYFIFDKNIVVKNLRILMWSSSAHQLMNREVSGVGVSRASQVRQPAMLLLHTS